MPLGFQVRLPPHLSLSAIRLWIWSVVVFAFARIRLYDFASSDSVLGFRFLNCFFFFFGGEEIFYYWIWGGVSVCWLGLGKRKSELGRNFFFLGNNFKVWDSIRVFRYIVTHARVVLGRLILNYIADLGRIRLEIRWFGFVILIIVCHQRKKKMFQFGSLAWGRGIGVCLTT